MIRVVRIAERVARGIALSLVALAIWRAFAPRENELAPVRLGDDLRAALAGEAMSPARPVHLAARQAPDVVERDWLVALRRNRSDVSWSDAGLAPPAAVAISRSADPGGAVTIAIAARDSSRLRVADALGPIDSAIVDGTGVRITAPSVQGSVRVESPGSLVARAAAPPERTIRPLLVIGSAGWEAKFIVAALEERGWTVHSRVRVSPTATVSQGPDLPLDTARYAAIIVLDSNATVPSAALVRYVRSGGGLVLAGSAASIRSLAAIVPARAGAPVAGSLLRSASARDRDGLPLHPLVALRADAVELDRRDGHIVVAARREGAGRVVSVGETESWRWRMSGGADAPASHRAWWSRIVTSVAYAPYAAHPEIDAEAAPYAALVDALGAPAAEPPDSGREPARALPWWLGVPILILLLAEWMSRRLRGER